MTVLKRMTLLVGLAIATFACNQESAKTTSDAGAETTVGGGQSAVKDDFSNPNVVQIAAGSADHTTLVAALKAAEYVDALSNAGPFTVFAPTNAAFEKLPAGTVDNLVKPENQATLRNILEHHVYIGNIGETLFQDGVKYGQANGDNVTLSVSGDKKKVNNANVLATIPASNGIIYVIDEVLLPPDKK